MTEDSTSPDSITAAPQLGVPEAIRSRQTSIPPNSRDVACESPVSLSSQPASPQHAATSPVRRPWRASRSSQHVVNRPRRRTRRDDSRRHTDCSLAGESSAHDDLPSGDLETGAAPASSRRSDGMWARHHHPDRPKLSFAQRSLRITWAWFAVNMSTGAMASLISQQPYTFRGLTIIGEIFYLVDLVSFTIFFCLIATRFARKPRAFLTSLHHPSESFFFGSFWVAVALLIMGLEVYGVPASGSWLTSAARILFWTYYACATLVAIFQYNVIFHHESMILSDAMPAWVLPAYPFLVIGVLAAAIAKTQPQQNAIRLIIAGIAGQGLGWMLAMFIYTVYLTRLLNSPMPDPSLRPGMYVSVGPAAYTCAGLLALGKEARTALPDDFLGLQGLPAGEIWYAVSVPAALFLWLIAIWFSAMTTISILRGVRKMRFALQWWAFVFPNAGLAIATIHIGDTLDNEGIRLVAVIITIALIPLWFLCAFMHIRDIWMYELLAPGKDVGVDDVNQSHDAKRKAHLERKLKRQELRKLRSSRAATFPAMDEKQAQRHEE